MGHENAHHLCCSWNCDFVSVSVIIPARNAQGTLARAISSVLVQTEPPHELIVVDDGSQDATGACVETFRDRTEHVPISLVRLATNRGPAAARNVGWDMAVGDHIAFLDADDSWHPQKLEIQHRWMTEHPEFAFSAHRIRYVRHAVEPQPYPASCQSVVISPWRLKLFSCLLWPSSLMLRAELAHRFDSARTYAEDRLLLLEMVLSGLKAARLELPLGCRYNAPYGERGLSRDLWKAERAELEVFRQLRKSGAFGRAEELWIEAFSLMKYAGRVCVCACRPAGRTMRKDAAAGACRVDPSRSRR